MVIDLFITEVDDCHFLPELQKSDDDNLEDILEVDEDVGSLEKSVIVVTEQPDPAVQGERAF